MILSTFGWGVPSSLVLRLTHTSLVGPHVMYAGAVIFKAMLRFVGTGVGGAAALGTTYFVVLCNGLTYDNHPQKVGALPCLPGQATQQEAVPGLARLRHTQPAKLHHILYLPCVRS